MRKIVALLFLFLPLSLYAQNGYHTNYTWGFSDLSARMSNTNLWFPIESAGGEQGLCNSVPAIGSDIVPVCVANSTPTPGPNNVVYYFDSTAFAWNQISALGTGWLAIASVNVNDLYLLKPASLCTNNGYGIFHWNGSTITQLAGCASQIHAQEDGGLLLTNNSQQIYYFPSGSSTWKYPGNEQSMGWTYASGANVNDMCGVKNGAIQLYDSDDSDGVPGQWVQMSAQPSSLVYSCEISNDPNSGLVMFATYRTTNNHGQYVTALAFYDFNTGAWTPIMSPPNGIMSAASIGKWPTVILDNHGYTWHFNVFGVYHAATLTGVYNQCPNMPCPPSGVTHNGTVTATLPGGLYGATGLAYPTPSEDMNLTSWDISATGPGCDGLFGNPQKCVPKDTGTIICSASKFNFAGTPSNGEPPEPQTHWTNYVGSFDQFFTTIKTEPHDFDGHPGYMATSLAGYTVNSCYGGHVPPCSPPISADTVTITTGCFGSGCTGAVASAKGRFEAKEHSKSLGMAWESLFNYTPGLTASCDRIVVYPAKVGTPCFP